jgi:hypothetical protein
MKNIFFAHSFKQPERESVRKELDDLLESHDIRLVVGESLGGRRLDEALKSEIRSCDGLIALFTRGKALKGGGYTTSDWVKEEYTFALEEGKNAVALVQNGVTVGGATGLELQSREYIDFDPRQRLECLLKLSRTLGRWKRQAGRPIRVLLQPSDIADQMRTASANNGGLTWKCKCIVEADGGEEVIKITSSRLIDGPGGIFVWLRGIKENSLVELEVTDGHAVWKSSATPQWVPVAFKKAGD